MAKRIIRWAGREKRRQTNKAIGGSLLKTMTELLTNSDSAVKKHLGLPHATGLVEAMLGLKKGDLLDTAALKKLLPKRPEGRIIVQLYTKQHRRTRSRTCQVIDYGPGMSEQDLNRNFGDYAGAKAKGERTRSLFGRGALDVFLYHSNQKPDDGADVSAHVFSVTNGILSYCRISWESPGKGEVDSIIDPQTLGAASPDLLKKYDLPLDMVKSGTVTRFLLADGVRIPQEGNFLSSMSNFYMLRLIAADPSLSVQVERYRTEGKFTDRLTYDFDVGTVLKRSEDIFRDDRLGEIPVDILVARSNRKMTNDPFNYERRENGLLFVDDNDAVLDLTLLPEYNKNPLLTRIYGVVRLTGIRNALEKLLEAQRPEAVLTETRDGFDPKNEIVKALFTLIEKHVKPVYEEEEKRERKSGGGRSAELDKKLKEALRELNTFHNQETDEEGTGRSKREPEGPLEFAFGKIRLVAGQDRRVTLYAERDLIHSNLNDVEITSSNQRVRVVPESEKVTRRKGSRFQAISITVSCPVKNEAATITARAISVDEQVLEATLEVTDVIELPQIPTLLDLEFRPVRYNGKPNIENQTVLLVNLEAFPGMPVIKFRILSSEGLVTVGPDRSQKFEVKAQREWIMQGSNIAKVVVPYWATAWGAKAEIEAKAKKTDGKLAVAKCKVDFREPSGSDKYEDFEYTSIGRQVLGEAAGKYIYVNSDPLVHQKLFGDSKETFEKALEADPVAQMRVAAIVADAVVYDVATKKYFTGGEKGLTISEQDPITAVREFVEAKRYELDSRIVRAFLKEGPQ
jgi:hypothetical protein